MLLNEINSNVVSPFRPLSEKKVQKSAFSAQQSFAKVLKQSIEQVNQSQLEADRLTEKLVKGENVELHQVMIAAQKATISLQTAVEIRNKVVEAYQEMMRMQV
ncbi:flagellar hook-basal body complex protein FliE [Aeribacillus pallidus]|jgi:flagellar hook-basal body complex protein FliE|uniref:flagellar hook-basal body complex protein FliE n=1 Tax=Aeribacillus pallidus TaxID=33936 RepID=UPI001DBEF0C3|nr:flagellar hook-basal body complex protein FliE [Bacillus sp. (in: firmicutes)]